MSLATTLKKMSFFSILSSNHTVSNTVIHGRVYDIIAWKDFQHSVSTSVYIFVPLLSSVYGLSRFIRLNLKGGDIKLNKNIKVIL